jgi:F-type H+-transporting ATPase subunit b
MEEYVWLTLAVILLIIMVWRPVSRVTRNALDGRSERIRKELDEAQRLHEEARSMLARYQRQLHEGETLAKEILERAEAERQRLEARLRSDFEALTERRTQQALDRIAQEEARTVAEVRARAASLAVRAARTLLSEKLDPEQTDRIMSEAVGEVTRKLA